MTKNTATVEAQRFVDKLVSKQSALGYRKPSSDVVREAVGEAAQAVQALASLAKEEES